MLRYYNFDVVCAEIPDQITLAINLSGCPNRCAGCHSPWLWEEVGEPLTEEVLERLVTRYEGAIDCLCLMGGDGDPAAIDRLAGWVRSHHPELLVGWYSGRQQLAVEVAPSHLDFLKLGPYIEALGGLRAPTTNQRLYRILSDGTWQRVWPSGGR